jgi:hypothetical protein
MADTVRIGDNSQEEVAYRLFRIIATIEGKDFTAQTTDKSWVLKTYAECINAVTNPTYHL